MAPSNSFKQNSYYGETKLVTIENTLNERHKTHGSFSDNARISQKLKSTIFDHVYENDVDMTDVQAESIAVICLKLSRIACNPSEPDHWRDIAGYATLAENELVDNRPEQTI